MKFGLRNTIINSRNQRFKKWPIQVNHCIHCSLTKPFYIPKNFETIPKEIFKKCYQGYGIFDFDFQKGLNLDYFVDNFDLFLKDGAASYANNPRFKPYFSKMDN